MLNVPVVKLEIWFWKEMWMLPPRKKKRQSLLLVVLWLYPAQFSSTMLSWSFCFKVLRIKLQHLVDPSWAVLACMSDKWKCNKLTGFKKLKHKTKEAIDLMHGYFLLDGRRRGKKNIFLQYPLQNSICSALQYPTESLAKSLFLKEMTRIVVISQSLYLKMAKPLVNAKKRFPHHFWNDAEITQCSFP